MKNPRLSFQPRVFALRVSLEFPQPFESGVDSLHLEVQVNCGKGDGEGTLTTLQSAFQYDQGFAKAFGFTEETGMAQKDVRSRTTFGFGARQESQSFTASPTTREHFGVEKEAADMVRSLPSKLRDQFESIGVSSPIEGHPRATEADLIESRIERGGSCKVGLRLLPSPVDSVEIAALEMEIGLPGLLRDLGIERANLRVKIAVSAHASGEKKK